MPKKKKGGVEKEGNDSKQQGKRGDMFESTSRAGARKESDDGYNSSFYNTQQQS
jgi:hypothetical protein